MSLKVNLDFKTVPFIQATSGTPGAKSQYLMQFKDAIEKFGQGNLAVPGFTCLPEEFFLAPYVRAGVFDPERKLLVDQRKALSHEPQFDKKELKLLRDTLEQFSGRIVAVRSDEKTAKGVGVFSTKFVYVNPDDMDSAFVDFTDALFQALSSQFSDAAMLFKSRIGMEHGIGIQIMPLIAEHMPDISFGMAFAPMLSIAGHTAIEKNEVRVVFGSGVGGSEDTNAIQVYFGPGRPVFNCKEFYGDPVQPKSHVLLLGRPLGDSYIDVIPWEHHLGFLPAVHAFKEKPFLDLAKNLGHDIYFEAAVLGEFFQTVVLTQIAPHSWAPVIRPDGEEILHVTGMNNVIGNAVSYCNGVADFDSTSNEERKGKLLMAHMYGEWLGTLWKSGPEAVLLRCSDHGSLTSHGAGIHRELRMPLLTKNITAHDALRYHNLRWARLAVYADELNHEGGIVLLER